MNLMPEFVTILVERFASTFGDWFRIGDDREGFPARRFGPAPVPLYIERARVDLNNSNFRER